MSETLTSPDGRLTYRGKRQAIKRGRVPMAIVHAIVTPDGDIVELDEPVRTPVRGGYIPAPINYHAPQNWGR